MIPKFVECWEKNKGKVENKYRQHKPDSYAEIVKDVVTILSNSEQYNSPDPERIDEINHGDYQGTLVYIIGAKGYQPSDYWYVKVGYDSCSGCDTLEAIGYDDVPDEEQLKDYMLLALHILQGLKKMGDEED